MFPAQNRHRLKYLMDLLVLISNSKLVPSKTTGLRPRLPDCPADVVLLRVLVEVAMEVLVLQTVEKLRISLKIVSTNPGKNRKKIENIGKKANKIENLGEN